MVEQTAAEADRKGVLNNQLIDWLIEHEYHMLTLPVEYGGAGCNIKELIMIHSLLGYYDESTALSIGWHLGIVGEVFELGLWSEEMMAQFAEDVKMVPLRIVSYLKVRWEVRHEAVALLLTPYMREMNI